MVPVMIVSDSPLFGQGLSHVLARSGRLDVVCLAGSGGGERLEGGWQVKPAAVLVDMAMSSAVETIHQLSEDDRELKIIALGLTEDEGKVLTCAEAGIAGYVRRDASLDDLLTAVEGAVRGELVCSRRVAAALLRRVSTLAQSAQPPGEVQLTPRETEIMSLLDEGLTNKEIAKRLGIEVGTVKNHVHNLLEKLDASSRSEAAAKGRRLRLLRRGPLPQPLQFPS